MAENSVLLLITGLAVMVIGGLGTYFGVIAKLTYAPLCSAFVFAIGCVLVCHGLNTLTKEDK